LSEGEYQEIAPDADRLVKSRVFSGLWLDTTALLRRDMKAVLTALRGGIDSPEHGAFVGKYEFSSTAIHADKCAEWLNLVSERAGGIRASCAEQVSLPHFRTMNV